MRQRSLTEVRMEEYEDVGEEIIIKLKEIIIKLNKIFYEDGKELSNTPIY